MTITVAADAYTDSHPTHKDALSHYRQYGWALMSQVFDRDDIRAMIDACERTQALASQYPQGYSEGSLRIVPTDTPNGPYLTSAQWPCYRNSTLATYRNHEKLQRIITPILGQDVKQVKSQFHWKPVSPESSDNTSPNDNGRIGAIKWHQDCQFRKPESLFRNLGTGGMQALIALDTATTAHGALQIHPHSHACGDLRLNEADLDQGDIQAVLAHAGLAGSDMLSIEMEPGDVMTFSPYIIHGSGLNHAEGERRVFINGYCSSSSCDIGVWAWQHGEPCALPTQPHPMERDIDHAFCHPHLPHAPETPIPPLDTF